MALGVPTKIAGDSLLSPDVLGRVRRGRRLRSAGWLSVLGTLFLYVFTQAASLSGKETALLVGIAATTSLLLINWTRLWVRESREPFKYTFSVGKFVPGTETGDLAPKLKQSLDWLSCDLSENLGARVTRLSLLEDEDVPETEDDEDPAPHVDISGWYGLRETESGARLLEIVPKVRVGGKGAPTKLATTVRYNLADAGKGGRDRWLSLDVSDYRRLFERVYWSVASQIYAQIREGVERKVKLLPPGRLRAAAYLSEADDYATSNTLDAYEAAGQLYRNAQEIYDVASRQRRGTHVGRFLSEMLALVDQARCEVRRQFATVVPALGRREILTARVQLGHAWMLVAQWHLKRMLGTVPPEIFGAIPNISGAIHRLEKTAEDVSERDDVLFRAWVTMATAKYHLSDLHGAKEALREAERMKPASAREDPEFLLAAGMIETAPTRSLRLLGRALELSPGMERAHFHRAELFEELWRGRDRLEPALAEMVADEYAKVTTVNPGNLAAWAHRGFVCWLLGPDDECRPAGSRFTWRELARSSLAAGRQYKEVRGEASVAELDWNLTRLAAEDGDFVAAYEHYTQAVSAMLGEPRLNFLDYFYKLASPASVARFVAYKERVLKAAEAQQKAAEQGEERLIRSVVAFVQNDCGLAHHHLYLRSQDEWHRFEARRCFEQAIAENPAFVLPVFNLAELDLQRFQDPDSTDAKGTLLEDIAQRIAAVLRREPDWASAQLLQAQTELEVLRWSRKKRASAEEEARRRTSTRWILPDNPPVPGIDPRSVDEVVARAKLDRMASGAKRQLQAVISDLLPHPDLRADGERVAPTEAIDLFGVDVRSLIASQQERWAHDYNEIHVAALAVWADTLALESPRAAAEFCSELRRVFSDSQVEILTIELRAVSELQSMGSEDRTEAQTLREAADDCIAHLRELLRALLLSDPAQLNVLWRGWMPDDEHLLALAKAGEHAAATSALVWLAEQRRELKDTAGALDCARLALAREPVSAAGPEWERLGDLFLSLDEKDAALESYRRGSAAGTPAASILSAVKAIAILEATGEASEVQEEIRRIEAVPALALELGEAKELLGDLPEAVEITRRATENKRLRKEQRASAQLALAERLLRLPQPARAEAEQVLRSAAETETASTPAAAVKLGELLAPRDPQEAEALFRMALAKQELSSSLQGALGLIGLLQFTNRSEECRDICIETAQLHPWLAVRLGDRLLVMGLEELAAVAYATGSDGKRPPRPFAADARLRLADLRRRQGDDDYRSLYLAAVQSLDLRVAPDAAISLYEALEEDGMAEEGIDETCRLAVQLAVEAFEPEAGAAVGFCREFGQRLEGMGKASLAASSYATFAELAPEKAPVLAEALRAAGDPALAEQVVGGSVA